MFYETETRSEIRHTKSEKYSTDQWQKEKFPRLALYHTETLRSGRLASQASGRMQLSLKKQFCPLLPLISCFDGCTNSNFCNK